MAKGRGLDDIARIIARAMKGKASSKVRYDFAKKAGVLVVTSPKASSVIKKTTKKAPSKSKKPAKVAGPKVGRIAKTPVARKPVDKYPKGKTIPQSESEQRAAERMANRYLRMKGGKGPAGDGKKPVDVKGSIISPPSKATLRQPKPRGSKSFEADPMRRLEGTPKPPKPSKRKPNQPKGTKPSQGTKKSKAGTTVRSSVKPKATMSSGSAQGKATRERDRVARQEVQHSKKIQDAIRSEWTKRRQERINELRAIIRDPKVKPAARSKAIKEMGEISRIIMKGK